MLKIWHLTVIREVIKTGSISKAASALGRSQPALSLVISDVEKMIGYKLFDRVSGRLKPVPETNFFLERSEEILQRMTDLERFMKRETHQFSQLRIACMPVASEFFLPTEIANFTKNNLGVRFYMQAQPSARVIESIASQQFDLGIAEQPQPSKLYSTRNFQMDTVIAIRADSPLAKYKLLTPKDLSRKPFVTFLPQHYLTRQLQVAFDNEGAILDIPFALQNGAAQYALIESGQAIGFMSILNVWLYQQLNKNLFDGYGEKIVFIPFAPKIQITIGLLTPRHRAISQIGLQFADSLKGSLEKILVSTELP